MIDEQNPLEGKNQPSAPSEGVAPEGQPKGRTAEDRIDELLSKNKETLEELKSTKEEMASLRAKFEAPMPAPAPVAPDETQSPDVQKAIDFLKSKGKFVDETQLKKEIQAVQDRNYLDGQHLRLENSYDGSDGRPQYDRVKIEEYMRTHPVYDPEIAYREIYKDELFDWKIKELESDRKKKPYVARPSSTAGQEAESQTITREKIQEWLDNPTPENRMKYEQNRDKILKLMADQKL